MKKRDLTKLALMGVAIGLCGGQIQADDLSEGMMDEQMYAASQGYPQQGYQQQSYPQGQQPQRVQSTREQVGNNYPVYDNKGGTTGKGVPVSQGTQAPADHPAGEKPEMKGQQPKPQQSAQQADKQASNQGKQYRKNGQTADNSGDAYMNGGCPANNQPAYPQNPNRQNPNSTNR